jgi:hypothetical protein
MKTSFASGKRILKNCIQTAVKKKNTKTSYLPKFEKEILYCESIESTKKGGYCSDPLIRGIWGERGSAQYWTRFKYRSFLGYMGGLGGAP